MISLCPLDLEPTENTEGYMFRIRGVEIGIAIGIEIV